VLQLGPLGRHAMAVSHGAFFLALSACRTMWSNGVMTCKTLYRFVKCKIKLYGYSTG